MKNDNKKIAVLLLNLGAPESIEGIQAFLFNLFSDREIIRLGPAFLQKYLARFIAKTRSREVIPKYNKIGGKSPLLEQTKCQAKALEKRLLQRNIEVDVIYAMRYSAPFIKDVCNDFEKYGKVVILPLFPQFSKTTTGSCLIELKKHVDNSNKIKIVDNYYNNQLFISSWVEKINASISKMKNKPFILFSAHSIPESFVTGGDPYISQTQKTFRSLSNHYSDYHTELTYQSRSGPAKWVGPSTKDRIKQLGDKNLKDMLVVPISFVSDHFETLYEIDIEFKEVARASGILNFARVESLNDSMMFIEALCELVIEKIEGKSKQKKENREEECRKNAVRRWRINSKFKIQNSKLLNPLERKNRK
ncbi:MAG: ferrochelatase [Pseudomonadota bacterium]